MVRVARYSESVLLRVCAEAVDRAGSHSDACLTTEDKYKHLCLPKAERVRQKAYVAKQQAYEGEIQSKYLEKRKIEDAAAADDKPDSGLAEIVEANRRELKKDELTTGVHEAKVISRAKKADDHLKETLKPQRDSTMTT